MLIEFFALTFEKNLGIEFFFFVKIREAMNFHGIYLLVG